MDAPKKVVKRSKKLGAPGKTVEARENQLINLAVELAEKQLAAGTASAQVITHFLKLASTKEGLEKEKLKKENLLLQAKTEMLQSQAKTEDLYQEAITAFGKYSGMVGKGEEEDDFEN